MSTYPQNIREKSQAVATWLGYHHENIAYGLRSMADAEKLYDYWQARPNVLPEFCDDDADDADDTAVDVRQHRISALGYDPLVIVMAGALRRPKIDRATEALRAAKTLLDSVAYVAREGDTKRPLRLIHAALSTSN